MAVSGAVTTVPGAGQKHTATFANIPGRKASPAFGTEARSLIMRVVLSIVGSTAAIAPSTAGASEASIFTFTGIPTVSVVSCC